MKLSRAQKKAEMKKAAEEIIEALLDWEEENKAPNLREIEDELLMLRKQFTGWGHHPHSRRRLERDEDRQRLRHRRLCAQG
jgi:hypothetical protein